MRRDTRTSFRVREDAPIDLSPAVVERYRILAEQERNRALARLFGRLFSGRAAEKTGHGFSQVPAE